LYREAMKERALRGQPLTQKEIAKEIRTREATVSNWNRNRRFLVWLGVALRESIPAIAHAGIIAIAQRTIAGSSKHGDLLLRYLEMQQSPEIEEGREGVPATNVKVGVAFYGLPTAPTPAEAEGQRPPAGSAMVVTAAGVLEDRGRK
jgi:hypothetical protein